MLAGGGALALLSLLLSACLFMPGKFTSALDVRKDGRFSFSYAGQIYFLPLSRMAQDAGQASQTFKPSPCHVGDDQSVERRCTDKEVAEQRSEWERNRASEAERKTQEAKSAAMFLGGIDPSDPRSGQELAERLRHQAGWRKVDYLGDGLFDVDYYVSGRLDHDFSFPIVERFPMANAFVQIVLRQDGAVRVDAPGYGGGSGAPFGALMGMAATAGAKAGNAGAPAPTIDGRFTLTTDGEILANNTTDGPQPDATGKRLDWTVGAAGAATPAALLRLSR
jgi:hypothetical protein